jgi:hypothetical protein
MGASAQSLEPDSHLLRLCRGKAGLCGPFAVRLWPLLASHFALVICFNGLILARPNIAAGIAGRSIELRLVMRSRMVAIGCPADRWTDGIGAQLIDLISCG